MAFAPGNRYRVDNPISPFSGVSDPTHGLMVEVVHDWGSGGRTGLDLLCVLVDPDLDDLTARHALAAMEDGLTPWPAEKIRTLYEGDGYGDFADDPDAFYVEMDSSTLRPVLGRPEEGTRVLLVEDVERYPHFIAPAGATGAVVESTDEVLCVRLDEPLAGAEEWDNEVMWTSEDEEKWENPPIAGLVGDALE